MVLTVASAARRRPALSFSLPGGDRKRPRYVALAVVFVVVADSQLLCTSDCTAADVCGRRPQQSSRLHRRRREGPLGALVCMEAIRCSRGALCHSGRQSVAMCFSLRCCCCCMWSQASAVLTAASAAKRRPTGSFSLSGGDHNYPRYVALVAPFRL